LRPLFPAKTIRNTVSLALSKPRFSNGCTLLRAGFSLVELLVVSAIIGMLV